MYRRRRRTPALPQFNDPGGIVYQPQAQCLANALQRERRLAGCPRSKGLAKSLKPLRNFIAAGQFEPTQFQVEEVSAKFGIGYCMCLTRAFLCVPVAFSNVISEHFKHWKSPEFPKRPMLLVCLTLHGSRQARPI